MSKKSTIFCDIDGTLIKYRRFETYTSTEPEPIISTIVALREANSDGNCIILTTARPEYLREHTISELSKLGIPYNQLVMGIARGNRILINDNESPEINRAYAICVLRNIGITHEDIGEFLS